VVNRLDVARFADLPCNQSNAILENCQRSPLRTGIEESWIASDHAQPSCLRLMLSFQTFVMWRILSPSNCIT